MLADDVRHSTLPFWTLVLKDLIEGDRRAGKWLAETGTGMSRRERYDASRARGPDGSMFYEFAHKQSIQQSNAELEAIAGGLRDDASPEDEAQSREVMRAWRYQFGPGHMNRHLRLEDSRIRTQRQRNLSSK
jgi:hypothetical protein